MPGESCFDQGKLSGHGDCAGFSLEASSLISVNTFLSRFLYHTVSPKEERKGAKFFSIYRHPERSVLSTHTHTCHVEGWEKNNQVSLEIWKNGALERKRDMEASFQIRRK